MRGETLKPTAWTASVRLRKSEEKQTHLSTPSDGDGSAESNQEYSYDAEGRFDSYKSDGDADADADGTWDFLLSPTTECLP